MPNGGEYQLCLSTAVLLNVLRMRPCNCDEAMAVLMWFAAAQGSSTWWKHVTGSAMDWNKTLLMVHGEAGWLMLDMATNKVWKAYFGDCMKRRAQREYVST